MVFCENCWKPTTACCCGHDPTSCATYFIDDEGWLRRCHHEPGHAGNFHEDGDWGWVTDEYGLPPVADPSSEEKGVVD